MSKDKFEYASREVFNFTIYAETTGSVGYTFKINTVAKNTFVTSDGNGFSELHIEDALINDELFYLALNGAFNGKDMRIEGESIVRDADTNIDHLVKISIDVARMDLYQYGNYAGEFVKPILVFRFPYKTLTGEPNMKREVIR